MAARTAPLPGADDPAGRAGIEMLADRSRLLPLLDPTGREMLMSCGAALYGPRLESGPLRDMVRTGLALPGAPQMVLQLGRAHTAQATARRPVSQVLRFPDPCR